VAVTFKPGAEQPKDFYSEVPVSVRVTGRFHNTLAFFDEVSRLPRIVTISNIQMKKAEGPGKEVVLQTDCNATTYRFLEEEARAKKEKPKKKEQAKPQKGKEPELEE
jgi:type IV pilus assembly protein PilO